MVALAMEATREMRMKFGLIVLAVALALAVGAWAQTAPVIEWQHDGANVTRFECVVDGGTPSDLGLPTPSGTTYNSTLSNCTGVMTNGTHSVVIQACNAVSCTAAAAITVVKL